MIYDVLSWLLAVLTLVLAWRVWRLEGKAAAGVRAARSLDDVFLPARVKTRSGETIRAFVATANEVGEVRVELHSLAHALGYEWKRTEAKEGWERVYVNPFDDADALDALRALEDELCWATKSPTKRPLKRPTKKANRATH